MSEPNPCPTCGYQIDRVERLTTENARLRAAIEDAVDTLEAVDLDVDNPLYDRLRAIVDEQEGPRDVS